MNVDIFIIGGITKILQSIDNSVSLLLELSTVPKSIVVGGNLHYGNARFGTLRTFAFYSVINSPKPLSPTLFPSLQAEIIRPAAGNNVRNNISFNK